MTDRLADIKARISVRNTLGIGRAETPYDEVAREVAWLVAEVERLNALWDAEHATVLRVLAERDTFAIEMKDESCASIDRVTAAACDKIDILKSALAALRQRHDELMAGMRGAAAADAERENDAATKAGVPFMGCDTLDVLAEAVLYERERATKAEAALAALRQRHAELREWLLADGELATITVAAVVEQLDAWARREP